MQDALDELGRQVAEQALVALVGRSCGAVSAVEYLGFVAGGGDDRHWELNWRADCTGMFRDVKLVVLPEFLEMDAELLTSQLAIMLTDQVLAGLAG